MRKNVSIRTKLVARTMTLISVIFVVLLSAVTANNILTVNKNIEKTKKNIHAVLIAKGKILAKNNSMAISGIAPDTSFTIVRNLISSTVADDEDLAYGIYMDTARVVLVSASKVEPRGIPVSRVPLGDSVSLWASGLAEIALKEFEGTTGSLIEFASPVRTGEKIIGVIRYGLSTNAMERVIKEAQASGRATRNQAILIILSTAIFSLAVGYVVLRKLADRITDPIGSLVNSSKLIARGNYDVPVKPESNDEIGVLAAHLESMRVTIKKYTDHLQVLIDEKLQQVNDILNNIDQGLFTINLDGTVNQEYSARANEILKVSDVASCSIKELLRLDDQQMSAFHTWLDLVQKKHLQQRWTKLARLAPVQNVELAPLPGTASAAYVAISYQCMYDKNGNLAKIMVLALDETEKRLKDLQVASERIRHENDVKAILSIANSPAEEIAEFMEDTTTRLRELRAAIETHLTAVNEHRENVPGSAPGVISKEQVDRLFCDFHTIKGNGGSYGFEMLAHYAHEAEDRLDTVRGAAGERLCRILGEINGILDKMDESVDDIHHKIKRIFGRDEGVMIRIPEGRVNALVDLSRTIECTTNDERVKKLVTECGRLSWKPLWIHLRKYQKLALKVARKVHKNINVVITNGEVLYPPGAFDGLDEVLIHLVRNAVDHGIEEPEVREEAGKGIGRLQFSFGITGEMRNLTISDDGRGIDFERIVEKSIAMNITTPEAAAQFSAEEKTELLFRGGISTAEAVTEISGRGGGMQIIKHKIAELGGVLDIESKAGKGTVFSITIPVHKETSHADT